MISLCSLQRGYSTVCEAGICVSIIGNGVSVLSVLVCQYYRYCFILFHVIKITYIETKNSNLFRSKQQ
jgi:hypothetical protein